MGLDMNFYKGEYLSKEEVYEYNKFDKERNALYSEKQLQYTEKDNDNDMLFEIATQEAIEEYEGNCNIENIIEIVESLTSIAYFRKHSDLHGYLADKYAGSQADEDDNCVYYVLDINELENLLEMINKELSSPGTIEKSEGFFWGSSCKDDWLQSKLFIEETLSMITEEEAIYYSAWY